MSFEAVKVERVVKEAPKITTLRFPAPFRSAPGQFAMVWLPGVDEVPMSLSYDGPLSGITIKAVGEMSSALSSLKAGDRIGVRGPLGRGWTIPDGRILCVGGGIGMAPVMRAAEAVGDPTRVDVAIGARNESEVIFVDRAEKASDDVRVTTDDGSRGLKGNAVALASSMMAERRYDMVLGCGPEIMNRFLLKACQDAKVPCQLSLERIMKCGSGLCGSCVVDGLRACADGPVFSGEEIARMTEFGRCGRDHCGRRA